LTTDPKPHFYWRHEQQEKKPLRSAAAHIRQALEIADRKVRDAGGTAEILDLELTTLVAKMATPGIMRFAK